MNNNQETESDFKEIDNIDALQARRTAETMRRKRDRNLVRTALKVIHTQAKHGKFDTVLMKDDVYNLERRDYVINELMRRGFRVDVKIEMIDTIRAKEVGLLVSW